MKKYYITITNQYGAVVFQHRSDSAERLVKLFHKESKGSNGLTLKSVNFGKIDTNISDRVWCNA